MNRGKTERLLNLVFALMATARPLSREDIRQSVSGYDSQSSSESFERMFERDKDELRSMGIPIITVSNAFDEVLGYRISQDNYRLIDLHLTARELEILSVTQEVWDQAVLGPAARSAIWKIESFSVEADTPQSVGAISRSLTGLARVRAREAAILPLLKAARERRVVQFTYKPLDKEAEKRAFEPWSIVCRGGRWYTVGFDQDRNDQRTFRLSRIQGTVVVTARNATAPPSSEIVRSIAFPHDDEIIEAVIDVAKTHGATLRRNAQSVENLADHDTLRISAAQSDLVEWILTSLPEVLSIQPAALRHSVTSTLINMEGGYGG